MSHTPGPWRVHQHDQINGELWLSIGFHTHDGTRDAEGRWIGPVAELKYLVAREDEQWANARLIAEAPNLLEALTELERAIDGFSRGENFYVRDHGLALMLARTAARNAIAKAGAQS